MQSVSIQPARYGISLAGLVFLLLVSPQVAAGAVECFSVPSEILGRDVSYCVSLPGGYQDSTRRYPVLYFLHGLFEEPTSWEERGGEAILEKQRQEGKLRDFVLILPDGGRSFYINSHDGSVGYEDFFIQEFIPWIDRNYRTLANADHRAVSGTSMGGYGALHLGMKYPHLFGAASAHSPVLVTRPAQRASSLTAPLPRSRRIQEENGNRSGRGNRGGRGGRGGNWRMRALEGAFGSPPDWAYWRENDPLVLAERPQGFSQLKLYFDCGDEDRYGFDEGARELHRVLEANGFEHEYAIRPGDHGWSFLERYLEISLQFHSTHFAD